MLKAARGTYDILPPDSQRWARLESILREVASRYNYQEIRTPIFEHAELFSRAVGEDTDIVSKEMYVFKDKTGRDLTLRPEGTASCARAFIEHGMAGGSLPRKFYYLGPMFRYEKPQAGRFREFRQFGVEVFGSESPYSDVEVIMLAMDMADELGLSHTELFVNSIGCPSCRKEYRKELVSYLVSKEADLCYDCRNRLERNPLRILDCKIESCKKAISEVPHMIDYLCDDCKLHWDELRDILQDTDIPYTVDTTLVRGLDYYTRTVFELKWPPLGSQSTILGGGRYDGLVEEIGGPSIPGVGFAMGLERVLLANEKGTNPISPFEGVQCFVVAQNSDKPEIGRYAFKIVKDLRKVHLSVDFDPQGRSLKSQMKKAHRQNASFVVILGEEEISKGTASVKSMKDGWQKEVTISMLDSFLLEEVAK